MGQFTDAHQEISETAPATITMPTVKDMPLLQDAEPPQGAIAPNPDTYEPTGNKFTRSHSSRTEEDNSNNPHASSQGTPDCSQQDNKKQIEEDNPPTPDIHPRTLDLITTQLDHQMRHQLNKLLLPQLIPPKLSLPMPWLTHCKSYLLQYQLP